jgi:hypothetical protein
MKKSKLATHALAVFLTTIVFLVIAAGTAFAERGDPLMAWPALVQIDWDAFHGKMVENCNAKFPNEAASFKKAIENWGKENSGAIAELRFLLRDRLKTIKGLSEAEATAQMTQNSVAFTDHFIKTYAAAHENVWKELCAGKYANEFLPAVDFKKNFSLIKSTVPTVRENMIYPPR